VFDVRYVINVVPTCIVAELCSIWDVQPVKAIYFFIVFSGIFGLSLGERSIRYVVVADISSGGKIQPSIGETQVNNER
jgi:hypothetical protein